MQESLQMQNPPSHWHLAYPFDPRLWSIDSFNPWPQGSPLPNYTRLKVE